MNTRGHDLAEFRIAYVIPCELLNSTIAKIFATFWKALTLIPLNANQILPNRGVAATPRTLADYYILSIAKCGHHRKSAKSAEIRAEHKSGHLREFTETDSYSAM